MVQDFTLNPKEQELYDKVTDYLMRPFLFGVPDNTRPLMTITIRKIMASSSYALSFTLERIRRRIQEYQETGKARRILDVLSEEDEILDEDDADEPAAGPQGELIPGDEMAVKAMREEMEDLESYAQLARSIGEESKAKALVEALGLAFQKMSELGANRKALIFTESCRTQEYLKDYLNAHGYGGKIVCFNGTNNSPEAKRIYTRWLSVHKGSDSVTGDPLIDRKQALTDFFEEEADIMIATEAGAEGINLQFCSMVVNYDMPWNPQRIEQRIGRVHRYGQKHDVVVVNFVNQSNAADRRVYQLLNSKFQLFEGVFGSSDEVLGAIESNIDFEQRLGAIYQTCRTESEINAAFDALQAELEEIISERMRKTKTTLLEHFDEDVIKKLKTRQGLDSERISQFNRHLWVLSLAVLDNKVSDIDFNNYSFTLKEGFDGIIPGRYSLLKAHSIHQIRLSSPLGQNIIQQALSIDVAPSAATFDLSGYPFHSATLEQFKGKSGYCIGYRVFASNAHDNEEELLICGISEDGVLTPDDFGKKLLELETITTKAEPVPQAILIKLDREFASSLEAYKVNLANRAQNYLNQEIDKLYAWADDNVYPLEDNVIALRKEIQAIRRSSKKVSSVSERIELRKHELDLSKKLHEAERKCNEARDYYDSESEKQIERLQESLHSTVTSDRMFIVHWTLQ